jgi:hypothetical protein
MESKLDKGKFWTACPECKGRAVIPTEPGVVRECDNCKGLGKVQVDPKLPNGGVPVFEMKPGRELDAEVETKVFGHTLTWESTGERGNKVPFWSNGGTPCPVRFYSTDIAAAMEVVEKFYSFWLQRTPSLKGLWCAGFAGTPHGTVVSSVGEAFAETAPHAICLAALKAVGG